MLLPGEVKINEKEASLRLGYPYDPDDVTNRMILRKLRAVMTPRYVWRETALAVEGELCSMEFAAVKSRNLAKNLSGCKLAVLFGVTMGSGTDRLIAQLNLLDPRQGFICDALASAMVESLCDEAERRTVENRPHRPRYSPGYGDLDISIQEPLLRFLNAGTTLGITLTPSYFMKPSKSVTAIIGVEPK